MCGEPELTVNIVLSKQSIIVHLDLDNRIAVGVSRAVAMVLVRAKCHVRGARSFVVVGGLLSVRASLSVLAVNQDTTHFWNACSRRQSMRFGMPKNQISSSRPHECDLNEFDQHNEVDAHFVTT